MKNERKQGENQRRALREELLSSSSSNDAGIYQLSFSDNWYREVRFNGENNPWIKIASAIREIAKRQTREGKRAESKEYVQVSFFDEGK